MINVIKPETFDILFTLRMFDPDNGKMVSSKYNIKRADIVTLINQYRTEGLAVKIVDQFDNVAIDTFEPF